MLHIKTLIVTECINVHCSSKSVTRWNLNFAFCLKACAVCVCARRGYVAVLDLYEFLPAFRLVRLLVTE